MSIVSNLILIILLCTLGVASRVFLTLAVYFDCKAKGVKALLLWTLLPAVFGWIPAVVYACVRSSVAKDSVVCRQCGSQIPSGAAFCPRCGYTQPKQVQNAKNSRVFIILFAVVYAAAVLVTGTLYFNVFRTVFENGGSVSDFFDEDGDFEGEDFYNFDEDAAEEEAQDEAEDEAQDRTESTYYDIKGNAYDDADDVVYYDAKGASYRFSSDDFCYKDDDGNAYASLQCFLDENGYFYFDKENKLTYDSEIKKYKDPESEKTYIPIMGVYWDAQGNMQSTY